MISFASLVNIMRYMAGTMHFVLFITLAGVSEINTIVSPFSRLGY